MAKTRRFGSATRPRSRFFPFWEEFFGAFDPSQTLCPARLIFVPRNELTGNLGELRHCLGAMGCFFGLDRCLGRARWAALQSKWFVSRAVQVQKTEKVPKNYLLVWPRAVDGL